MSKGEQSKCGNPKPPFALSCEPVEQSKGGQWQSGNLKPPFALSLSKGEKSQGKNPKPPFALSLSKGHPFILRPFAALTAQDERTGRRYHEKWLEDKMF
jgi:hypothetical protein